MKPRAPAWTPVKFDVADIEAFKSLQRGDCPSHLQQRALKWLIEMAADTYGATNGTPFRSEVEGGAREEAFLLGRRFVGESVVKLLNASHELKDALMKTKES